MREPIKLFKLTAADAQTILASTNEPHNHDYEELIFGLKGGLEHFIDFQSIKIEAPFVSFVTKGKVHRLKPVIVENEFEIWVIRFKSEFIPETTFQLYSYFHQDANLVIRAAPCFPRLIALCSVMFDVTLEPTPDFAVLRHLLSTLFTMIEAERKFQQAGEPAFRQKQQTAFKKFLALLEENFREPKGVEFYAKQLFMTGRNLNLICQRILQQSVSEIIETRKLIEAKNLLISTDLTISEIGYELGYKEKSHFTAVFKRRSGQTPTAFREEMKTLVS